MIKGTTRKEEEEILRQTSSMMSILLLNRLSTVALLKHLASGLTQPITLLQISVYLWLPFSAYSSHLSLNTCHLLH